MNNRKEFLEAIDKYQEK